MYGTTLVLVLLLIVIRNLKCRPCKIFFVLFRHSVPAWTLATYTYPPYVGIILPTDTILRRWVRVLRRETEKLRRRSK